MKFQPDRALMNGRGTMIPLREFLIEMLLNGAGLPPDQAMPAVRLADKVTGADRELEISDVEEKLLKQAIAGHGTLQAWARATLDYLLWPGSLADSDRAIIEKQYSEEHSGPTETNLQ